MRFDVWAPNVERLELALEGRRLPMQRAPGGWWFCEVRDAPPEVDYGYCLNGGDPLPDPRSPWQPHGVHGLSRTVDHSAFRWTDQYFQARPLSSALIYELHVGTFTPQGTFEAAIEKLDHLVSVGVTHVELMPVADFPGARGWGYDGVDLYAPRHQYGGPLGLKRLVDACHDKGLAVLLDVVYNHLGPLGNYLAQFGPYFTQRHHTPWGAAINYDGPGSDEVRRYICDNALMWLRDYHIDGLRLDAVHAIIDTSAMHILEQLATEVEILQAHLGRHLVLIAESDLNDPRLVRHREANGYGLDAQWSDDFHHALHSVLTGDRSGYYADFGTLENLAQVMKQPFLYDGSFSHFRGRRHGRAPVGLSGHRFLGYLQNHDQVGNRARGDRTSHLVSLGLQKVGTALVQLSPYVPMLFQGEEWGCRTPFQYFVDFSSEPPLAEAVRNGRRQEFVAFGWKPEDVPDPQDEQTFLRSKLDWDELKREPHSELLQWTRDLVALRRRFSALSDGRLHAVQTSFNEEERWLAFQRGPIFIAANFSSQRRTIPLGQRAAEVLLASDRAELKDGEILLSPESIAVVRIA